MAPIDLALPHPQTGEPCQCRVWIQARHAAADGANISWHAVVARAGQADLQIGPRSSMLMTGALLLSDEALARALLERSLAA